MDTQCTNEMDKKMGDHISLWPAGSLEEKLRKSLSLLHCHELEENGRNLERKVYVVSQGW